MCIVAILFGLYLVWLALTPFALAWRAWKYDDRSSFSFIPFVEMVLLPVLILLSALSSGTAWYNHPLQVALWGILAVVCAYGCFTVLVIVLGNLLMFFCSKDGKTENQTEDK